METGQTNTREEENQKTPTEECHLTGMISITPIVSTIITTDKVHHEHATPYVIMENQERTKLLEVHDNYFFLSISTCSVLLTSGIPPDVSSFFVSSAISLA